MHYVRMPIEIESPEQLGYDRVRYNLTESSLTDVRLQDLWPQLGLDQALRELVLCYSDHRGNPDLRALIAEQSSTPLQPGAASLGADDVLVTPGAALALFIIATTLLERGDHLIVVRPNYATNIETPRAIGCAIDYVDLAFEDGFRLDPARIERLIRAETKLISVTTPHNPTGTALSRHTLNRLIALAEQKDIRLLVDETYRDMSFVPQLPVAASLSDQAISVASMSKSYGIPGIRVGWLITQDAKLFERFLAAKEQIGICGSIIDEHIAEAALAQSVPWISTVERNLKSAVGTVEQWLTRETRMEWVRPQGGCVCFPRIKADANIDVEKFYRTLTQEHATAVGPGHWFEQDKRFMRIGFGWPLAEELEGGLKAISKSLDASRR